MVIDIALSSCENSGIGMHSKWNWFDMEYANDVELVNE